MREQISIERAAEIMGVSPQTLRVGLQKGVFPFGAAIKMPGSSRFTYVIFNKKFEEYYGQINETN